tara:strand:- start:2371 stop:3495 length:1125 start_codon:yes stop_codon:yes gene_type:complete
MKFIKKIKNFGFVGGADVFGSGISGGFWFVLATLIEPEVYGELFFYIGIAGVASTFALVGTRDTLIVYIAKKIKIQSTLYFISIISAIVGSTIIIILFYRVDVAFLCLGYTIMTLAISDLLGRKLFSSYAKYNILQKILTFGLGISFFFIFGIEGILYALALSFVAYTIIIVKGLKSQINFRLIKTHSNFIIHNYTSNAVLGVWAQIDKLIIPSILGFTILGNYSLALQIMNILTIFPAIVYKIILPLDSSGETTVRIKKISLGISGVITVFGITILPSIIGLFFEKYELVVDLIQIMSIGIILGTINYFYTSKFLSKEKSKHVLIATLISLISIVLGMIILGSLFGAIGLAMAFVITTATQTGYLAIIDRFGK